MYMFSKLTNFTKKVLKLPTAFNLLPSKLLANIKNSRRVRLCVLIVTALLLLVAFALPKFLSTPACKRKLEVYIGHKLHKRLSIGSVAVTFFPLGIVCRKVVVKSPWYALHTESLGVSLAILPIVTGRLVLDSITLAKPKLDIYPRKKTKSRPKRKLKKITKHHVPSKPAKRKGRTLFTFQNLAIKDGTIAIHSSGELLELPVFSLYAKAMSRTRAAVDISLLGKPLLKAEVFTAPQSSLDKATLSKLRYKGKLALSGFDLGIIKSRLSKFLCLNGGYADFSGEIEGEGEKFKLLGDFSVLRPVLSLKEAGTADKSKEINFSMVSSRVKAIKNKEGLQVILPNLLISTKEASVKCRGGYKLSRKNKAYLFLEGESKTLPASLIQNFTNRCSTYDNNTVQCEKLNISGNIENMSFIIEGNPAKMSVKKLFSSNSWLQAKMEIKKSRLAFTHYRELPSLEIKSDVFFKYGCMFVNNMSITSGKILLNNMQGVFSPRREGGFYHLSGKGIFPVSDTLNFAYSIGKKKHQNKISGSGTANVSFGISHGMRSGVKTSLLIGIDDASLAYGSFKKERGVPAHLSTNMEFPPEGGMFFYNGDIGLGKSNINFIGQRLLRAFYFVESKKLHLNDIASILPEINEKSVKGEGSIKAFINIGALPDKRLVLDGNIGVSGVSYKDKLYDVQGLTGFINAGKDDVFNMRLSAESLKNKNIGFKKLEWKADVRNVICKYAPKFRTNLANAQGKASFNAKDGMFRKYGLLGKIFVFLHPIELFRKSLSEWQSDSFKWESLTGDFNIKDGVLRTDNLLIDSSSIDFTAQGKLDLTTHLIDGSIYAQPFSHIDDTLKEILELSKIAKKEDAPSLSLGFNVSGDVKKPKLKPLPSALYKIKRGAKVVGKQLEKVGKKLLKGLGKLLLGQ